MTLRPIAARYLICLNVKHYLNSRGVHYFDCLWHQDLARHVAYLAQLTLACPCQEGEPPPDAIAWTAPQPEIRIVDLPAPSSLWQAVVHLPATARQLWRAIGATEIVHLGVAGWPIPLGWLATPLALIRRKPIVMVIESAPWRLNVGTPPTLKNRARAAIFETLGRWCANRATVVIVTQDEYRRTLLADPDRGHIVHASWVGEEHVLSDATAEQSWNRKRPAPGSPLKLLFAGRLERAKGVLLLLEAMQLLSQDKIPIELSILGQGELLSKCEQACLDLPGATKARICGSMPYDDRFFQFLREHHAVIIPSLSDEQPRIVYDAYSQAVPVLAGNTAGLRACVENGKTGMIVDSSLPESWAALIQWCRRHAEKLPPMGMAGLQRVRAMTHQEMHRRRWQILAERFGQPR